MSNEAPFGWLCISAVNLEPLKAFTQNEGEVEKYLKSGWSVKPLYDVFAVSRHSKRLIEQQKERIEELTTDRDTLREALNALQPQPKVLKECAEGWGHGGFWCGPSYKCWLDPRPKDERD